jgi:hypothetical protein
VEQKAGMFCWCIIPMGPGTVRHRIPLPLVPLSLLPSGCLPLVFLSSFPLLPPSGIHTETVNSCITSNHLRRPTFFRLRRQNLHFALLPLCSPFPLLTLATYTAGKWIPLPFSLSEYGHVASLSFSLSQLKPMPMPSHTDEVRHPGFNE